MTSRDEALDVEQRQKLYAGAEDTAYHPSPRRQSTRYYLVQQSATETYPGISAENNDDDDDNEPQKDTPISSSLSLKSLYKQMWIVEITCLILGMCVLTLAIIFLVARSPNTIMAAAGVNVAAATVQTFRLLGGVMMRPRSKSDARPRKSTLVHFAVGNVLWFAAFASMLGLYAYETATGPKRSRRAVDWGAADGLNVLERRKGWGYGGRNRSGNLKYEDIPPAVFWACGATGAAILYVVPFFPV